MRALVPVVLVAQMLSGCALLGYHRRPKAERAPPEEAQQVSFPDSFEGAIDIRGPLMAAVEVSMNDFLSPGAKVTVTDGYEPLEQCLSRRDTYDVVALPYGDGLFYVSFTPHLERCGLANTILDGGAEYILDGRGRILSVR
jgi:hypothetical protein